MSWILQIINVPPWPQTAGQTTSGKFHLQRVSQIFSYMFESLIHGSSPELSVRLRNLDFFESSLQQQQLKPPGLLFCLCFKSLFSVLRFFLLSPLCSFFFHWDPPSISACICGYLLLSWAREGGERRKWMAGGVNSISPDNPLEARPLLLQPFSLLLFWLIFIRAAGGKTCFSCPGFRSAGTTTALPK